MHGDSSKLTLFPPLSRKREREQTESAAPALLPCKHCHYSTFST